jgi:hypothetical protein
VKEARPAKQIFNLFLDAQIDEITFRVTICSAQMAFQIETVLKGSFAVFTVIDKRRVWLCELKYLLEAIQRCYMYVRLGNKVGYKLE